MCGNDFDQVIYSALYSTYNVTLIIIQISMMFVIIGNIDGATGPIPECLNKSPMTNNNRNNGNSKRINDLLYQTNMVHKKVLTSKFGTVKLVYLYCFIPKS